MRSADVDQATLARRTGFSPAHISMVLRGSRKVPPALHRKAIEILGVHAIALDELYQQARMSDLIWSDRTDSASLKASTPFWANLVGKNPTIVVGMHDRIQMDDWERSGMIGLGDLRATIAIQRQLWSAGIEAQVVGAEDLSNAQLEADLILIGGPDGNKITAHMMGRLDSSLSFIFPRWSEHYYYLVDKVESREIVPEFGDRSPEGVDYGIIISAPNPVATNSELRILSGCQGYGTTAAAKALGVHSFLENPVCCSGEPFEALVRTEVVEQSDRAPVVIEARLLESYAEEKAAWRLPETGFRRRGRARF
jgi:hypothetical protein